MWWLENVFQLKLLRCDVLYDNYHAQITVQNTIIINRTGQKMCNTETRLNMVGVLWIFTVCYWFFFYFLSEWSTMQVNTLMFSLKLWHHCLLWPPAVSPTGNIVGPGAVARIVMVGVGLPRSEVGVWGLVEGLWPLCCAVGPPPGVCAGL